MEGIAPSWLRFVFLRLFCNFAGGAISFSVLMEMKIDGRNKVQRERNEMKKALLVISFGTAVPQARVSIEAVEQALRAELPGRDCFHAFTSPTIRKILARRGECIPSLEEALEQLKEKSYEDVIVQPTHVLYGFEYDKIRETVHRFAAQFARLVLGRPLLADHQDLCALAEVVIKWYHPADALVLLGHGTEHFANMVYPALQTAFRLRGSDNIYVGTVEGWPGADDVLAQLKKDGRKEVLIAPLMLVAGDHALHDMAGEDPDSWKSRLEAAGFTVTCQMEGLGIIPEVQEMYRAHLRLLG